MPQRSSTYGARVNPGRTSQRAHRTCAQPPAEAAEVTPPLPKLTHKSSIVKERRIAACLVGPWCSAHSSSGLRGPHLFMRHCGSEGDPNRSVRGDQVSKRSGGPASPSTPGSGSSSCHAASGPRRLAVQRATSNAWPDCITANSMGTSFRARVQTALVLELPRARSAS